MMTLGVRLLLLTAISFGVGRSQDQEICEGKDAKIHCLLDSTIRAEDVQWHRFIRDTSQTEGVTSNGQDIIITTETTGNMTSSTLTIDNVKTSQAGFFWVATTQSHIFCNTSLSVLTSPPDLTVNITRNISDLSTTLQWDAVDDSLSTTYTVTWTSERDLNNIQVATLIEQSSYTITRLTLDTVYIITVTAVNRCGGGPEFTTNVILSMEITSTISSISPTIVATTVAGSNAVASPSIVTATFAVADPTSYVMTLVATSLIDPSASANIDILVSTTADITMTPISNPGITTSVIDTENTMTINETPQITVTMATTTTRFTTNVIYPTTSTATTTTTATTMATTTTTTTATTMTTTTTTTMATTMSTTIATTMATTTGIANPSTTTTVATTTNIAVSPTPTEDVSDTTDENNDDGFNLEDYRYFAAGALGGLILFIVIVVICCCCCCCRRRRKGKAEVDSLKLNQYSTLASNGTPSKEVPSATNAMAIDEHDGEVKQGTGNVHQISTTTANFTASDTSEEFDLKSQPLHPSDTYDKLQPQQPPVHPTNTYDRLPSSNTFDQMPFSAGMYDKLPPSKTIHNFPSNNTYDKLPSTPKAVVMSPSRNTHDELPATPSNTYDRLPASTTFDKLPSTNTTYDRLPSSNTVHNFPLANTYDKLPSTPSKSTYDKLPSSNTFDRLPSSNTGERLPATDTNKAPQTTIEEIPESQTSTEDGVHYYDELPCNVKKEKLKIEEIKIEEIKKDDHTGEIAYQAEEHPSVQYAVLQPLPTAKNKLIFHDDPSKLYAQIA